MKRRNDADGEIRILGAGLSGLSAAINLKLAGKNVKVFEKMGGAGRQARPNFQCMRCDFETPGEYLGKLNLYPKYEHCEFSKFIFLTRNRHIDLNLSNKVHFVRRGGPASLEYGLYRQAKKAGVEFEFCTTMQEGNANIVATGPKRADIVAFGARYKNVEFDRDRFLMMYDDRYSPRGFYFYIIPDKKNGVTAINCVSQPYGPQVKLLFQKAINERKELREILGDAEPQEFVGGMGNISYPKTAIRNGTLYTGEAAGFQDATYGFGMTTALESGKLAADAIADNTDYDSLWKNRLRGWMAGHLGKRFAVSMMGDWLVERIVRKYRDGDTVNLFGLDSKFLKRAASSALLRLELLKHEITGFW